MSLRDSFQLHSSYFCVVVERGRFQGTFDRAERLPVGFPWWYVSAVSLGSRLCLLVFVSHSAGEVPGKLSTIEWGFLDHGPRSFSPKEGSWGFLLRFVKSMNERQVWWLKPVIPALGRQRQWHWVLRQFELRHETSGGGVGGNWYSMDTFNQLSFKWPSDLFYIFNECMFMPSGIMATPLSGLKYIVIHFQMTYL